MKKLMFIAITALSLGGCAELADVYGLGDLAGNTGSSSSGTGSGVGVYRDRDSGDEYCVRDYFTTHYKKMRNPALPAPCRSPNIGQREAQAYTRQLFNMPAAARATGAAPTAGDMCRDLSDMTRRMAEQRDRSLSRNLCTA